MTSSARSEKAQPIGSHLVESEGDDLLVLRARGDFSAPEARQLIRLDRELARRNGYALILIDGTRCGKFGPGAREAFFAEMKLHPGYMGTTAMFGLPGPVALLMRLVLRAIALLGKTFDDEMQMFASEPEARAFLNLRRPQRQQQAAQRRR